MAHPVCAQFSVPGIGSLGGQPVPRNSMKSRIAAGSRATEKRKGAGAGAYKKLSPANSCLRSSYGSGSFC